MKLDHCVRPITPDERRAIAIVVVFIIAVFAFAAIAGWQPGCSCGVAP